MKFTPADFAQIMAAAHDVDHRATVIRVSGPGYLEIIVWTKDIKAPHTITLALDGTYTIRGLSAVPDTTHGDQTP